MMLRKLPPPGVGGGVERPLQYGHEALRTYRGLPRVTDGLDDLVGVRVRAQVVRRS